MATGHRRESMGAATDESGNPVAILETNNDITEQKEAEERLRRSQAFLAEGQRISRTGSWTGMFLMEKLAGQRSISDLRLRSEKDRAIFPVIPGNSSSGRSIIY